MVGDKEIRDAKQFVALPLSNESIKKKETTC